MAKLNMGCGTRLMDGFVNADIAPLDGVDVITDFASPSWPFRDNSFTKIIAADVVEHLPDLVTAVEEIWRISRNGAEVVIKTPYWNNWRAVVDPTHKLFFHEKTFDFFDEETEFGKQRPYYSKAKFRVERVIMSVNVPLVPSGFPFRKWVRKWVRFENPLIRRFLSVINRPFGFVGAVHFHLCVNKSVDV